MPDPPAYIGRYRVVERLTGGGMGFVYLARDLAIDRTVAIKVARVQSVELRERFLREARATGRLNHPNIVTIYDVGEHDGEPFIAMEYVPGRTLAEIISRRTPLSLEQRLRMMRELCDGLAYAHGQGIVHRDVKPANLIARADSGALTILDFGIARLSDALTMTGGGVVGTPNYMAPEQVQGGQVDHRCDIFAVGLVFYELLSYRRAFDADNPTAVIYQIVHEQPVPLVELMPELDAGVRAIVERALAKRADDRYRNLRDLLVELDAALGGTRQEDHDAESTVSLASAEETWTPPPSGGRAAASRAELLARREERLQEHLDAARAALDQDLCDAAQTAAEQAALIDPDDDRVLRTLERIDAVRLARQVDEHLAKARGHLEDRALTRASESVDAVLQLQPKSRPALQLRLEIESLRKINGCLEKAEQHLGSGEFTDARRSVNEALALDGEHAAALSLKERIGAAARDHRAQTTVDEARARRRAGDLAAAQAILEDFDGAHKMVSAELASVRKEITQRRESFEALMAQARNHLEHGKLQDARDPIRQALDALAAGEPEPSSEPERLATAATRTDAGPRPRALWQYTREFGAAGLHKSGRARGGRTLVAIGAVAIVAAVAVGVGMWLSSRGPSEQEPDLTARRGAVAPSREDPVTASEAPVSQAEDVDADPAEDGAGSGQARRIGPLPAGAPRAADPAPDPPARPAASPEPSPPPSRPGPPPPPPGPDIGALLADAAAAEAAGDLDGALDIFDTVLGHEADNGPARAGRQRVEAMRRRNAVEENLRAANAAFGDARYADARRLFQAAFDLNASPAAADGLRRVDNAEAVLCPADGAACGTLVIRVTPAAEIFVDERSLGVAGTLVLQVPAGRHRVRLETAEWRFPRALEVAAGTTSEIDVDLERDGFPK